MRIIDLNTVQVDASYDEPTENSDGTPLEDLAYTQVFYQPEGAAAPIMGAKTAATKPTGGGHIDVSLIVPAPAGKKTSLDFWTSEVDLAGNPSVGSTHVTFVVDRIAPAPSSNFTIA
jgi:hypothetical protein